MHFIEFQFFHNNNNKNSNFTTEFWYLKKKEEEKKKHGPKYKVEETVCVLLTFCVSMLVGPWGQSCIPA